MSGQIVKQEPQFERSTKRTHVFKANTEEAKVRSIYIDKSAFAEGQPPARIAISITEAS